MELDATHWAIEPGVPINTPELLAALIERWPQWSEQSVEPAVTLDVSSLRSLSVLFSDLLHHQYRPVFSRFAQRYAELDPDRETRPIVPLPVAADSSLDATSSADAGHTVDTQQDVQRISLVGKQVLIDAAYTEVTQAEMELAVAQCSPWGVPLHVEFDVFDAILMFARGDVIGQRSRRYWRNWFRMTSFDVPMYQRVVVMFKLRAGYRTEDNLDDKLLHLRMFKNIPQQDIDMLLPGTSIRFSWYDYMRNVGPTLGGIGVTLFKIGRIALFVAVFTLNIAAVLAGLCIVLVGYLIRSVMNHQNAKNRYMLNLTRNLYHQKLDSNAGVAYRLLQEAESQRHRELLLAYYALWSAGQPISPRRLRRRVERMVRQLVELEIAFRAPAAIDQLRRWGVLRDHPEGKISCIPPAAALTALRIYWDQLHHP